MEMTKWRLSLSYEKEQNRCVYNHGRTKWPKNNHQMDNGHYAFEFWLWPIYPLIRVSITSQENYFTKWNAYTFAGALTWKMTRKILVQQCVRCVCVSVNSRARQQQLRNSIFIWAFQGVRQIHFGFLLRLTIQQRKNARVNRKISVGKWGEAACVCACVGWKKARASCMR